MSSAHLKKWIYLAITLALVGLTGYYIYQHREQFRILTTIRIHHLLPIIGAVILSLFFGACLLNTFLRHYHVRLPWHRWFGLYIMQTVGNLVTPARGGTGVCALYLKSAHGMHFRRFAVVLLGTYILSALVNASLALIGMGFAYLTQGWFNLPLLILSATILLGCIATFFVPNFPESDRWLWKYVPKMINSWHALVSDRPLLKRVAFFTLILNFSQVLCYTLIYSALNLEINIFAVLTIVSIGTIGSMASPLPASLGLYDAALVTVPAIYGLTVEQAASALLIYRVTWFFTTFLLAPIFSFTIRPNSAPPTDPEPPETP